MTRTCKCAAYYHPLCEVDDHAYKAWYEYTRGIKPDRSDLEKLGWFVTKEEYRIAKRVGKRRANQ